MKLIIKKIIRKLNSILKRYSLRITIQSTKRLFNYKDLSKGEIEKVNNISKLTMVSQENVIFLISVIKYLKKKNVVGDYAETGVWKGGLSILSYQMFLENIKKRKRFYLYDTFEGMVKPGNFDRKINKNVSEVMNKWKISSKTKGGWNISSLDEVKHNIIRKCGKSSLNDFVFIKGKVEDTLKNKRNIPKKICLLRLDTDFYNSTKSELTYLFNRVSKGGVVIFDDYTNWLGAKKAIDDFLKNKKYLLCKIDNNSRFIIK